ncbi:MAG: hypothetical protein GY757_10065 [bacterium]|nr:hypothetical protein [bacterium]
MTNVKVESILRHVKKATTPVNCPEAECVFENSTWDGENGWYKNADGERIECPHDSGSILELSYEELKTLTTDDVEDFSGSINVYNACELDKENATDGVYIKKILDIKGTDDYYFEFCTGGDAPFVNIVKTRKGRPGTARAQ